MQKILSLFILIPTLVFAMQNEDVHFGPTGRVIAGTLYLPEQAAPKYSAILLVSGSGPNRRECNVAEFPIMLRLAEHLTSKGFAVLAFDKRGCGQSEGSFSSATLDDFALDATEGLKFLRQHPKIDASRIGLIGHSEGAAVSARVARNEPSLGYVISMAGTGISGYDILLYQTKVMTPPGENAELAVERQKIAMDAILSGNFSQVEQVVEETTKRFTNGATEQERAHVRSTLVQMYTGPWFRQFLTHNPSEDWKEVNIPVLALLASKDTQVPVSLNREPIESALKRNSDAKVIVLDGVNHAFQAAESGLFTEISSLEPEFSPLLLEVVLPWIQAHSSN